MLDPMGISGDRRGDHPIQVVAESVVAARLVAVCERRSESPVSGRAVVTERVVEVKEHQPERCKPAATSVPAGWFAVH
jgi:hypothetical protein